MYLLGCDFGEKIVLTSYIEAVEEIVFPGDKKVHKMPILNLCLFFVLYHRKNTGSVKNGLGRTLLLLLYFQSLPKTICSL